MNRDQFLKPAVKDAAVYLSIPEDGDNVLKIAAAFALSQVEAYLLRPIGFGAYTEIHEEVVSTNIMLMIPPVTEILSVTYGAIELEATQFKLLKGGMIYWKRPDTFFTALDEENIEEWQLLIEYYGGYNSCSANSDISSALTLQTVANFNRRNTVGLSQVSGAKDSGSITNTSDKGDLLAAAKEILSPYVYVGTGRLLR